MPEYQINLWKLGGLLAMCLSLAIVLTAIVVAF